MNSMAATASTPHLVDETPARNLPIPERNLRELPDVSAYVGGTTPLMNESKTRTKAMVATRALVAVKRADPI